VSVVVLPAPAAPAVTRIQRNASGESAAVAPTVVAVYCLTWVAAAASESMVR